MNHSAGCIEATRTASVYNIIMITRGAEVQLSISLNVSILGPLLHTASGDLLSCLKVPMVELVILGKGSGGDLSPPVCGTMTSISEAKVAFKRALW